MAPGVLRELIVPIRADHEELAGHLFLGHGREERLERQGDLVEARRMDVQMDEAEATASLTLLSNGRRQRHGKTENGPLETALVRGTDHDTL